MDSPLRNISHILIIDDNLQHRRDITTLLGRLLKHARLSAYEPDQHPPLGLKFPWQDYKLVIMDVGSNAKRRRDWFKKLSGAIKLPPFIFLHADCNTDDAVDFMRLGGIDYICKSQLQQKRFMKALMHLPELASGPSQSAKKSKPTMPLPDAKKTITLGQYTLRDLIGKGTTAWVYRVTHKTDKHSMALKLCLPQVSRNTQSRDRFIHEFEIIKGINHPNIVKIYELGVQKKDIYSVMELLPAGDLKQKIDNGLSPAQAVSYTAQISAALYETHQRNIIHRDLKPANILFRKDGSLALIDFGIARLIKNNDFSQTDIGMMVGTPSYVSPEQAVGSELDARTDLYTLGIILYEMLEGRKPFSGTSAVDIMYAHASSPVPDLSKDYGELNNIVMRLLEKQPDDRYADGLELLHDLQHSYPEHVDKLLFEML